jgi:hypothetical protein
MASKPSVTLTFAGDSDKLTRAMGEVGGASERLGRQVGDASEKMRHAGASAESLAERTDTAETRATGFADTLSGVTDGLAAWGDESLSTQDKMIAMGQAGADLAGGMTGFLIPAIAAMSTGLKVHLLTAMNFVAAHPLVFALLAIAAILIWLLVPMDRVKAAFMSAFNAMGDIAVRVGHWIMDVWRGVIDWFDKAPERFRAMMGGVGEAIKGAFKSAFNFVADLWNNGIGRLSFSIPSWVPIIGGNSFAMPHIPRFHGGGTVPGMPGEEVLILAQAGERVTRAGASSSPATVRFAGNLADGLGELIMELIRTRKIVIEV